LKGNAKILKPAGHGYFVKKSYVLPAFKENGDVGEISPVERNPGSPFNKN